MSGRHDLIGGGVLNSMFNDVFDGVDNPKSSISGLSGLIASAWITG